MSQDDEAIDVKDLTDAVTEAMDLARYSRFTLKEPPRTMHLNTRNMTK